MSTRTGTTGIAPFVIQDDAIPQPAAYADQLNKGWHTRNTLTERDAMPLHYRGWGMVCAVTNDGNNNGVYQLTRPASNTADNDEIALLDNGNWKVFGRGAETRIFSSEPAGGWQAGDIWLYDSPDLGYLAEVRKITFSNGNLEELAWDDIGDFQQYRDFYQVIGNINEAPHAEASIGMTMINDSASIDLIIEPTKYDGQKYLAGFYHNDDGSIMFYKSKQPQGDVIVSTVSLSTTINYSATDPEITDPGFELLAPGFFGIWKNTTTNTLKLWANDNGVLSSMPIGLSENGFVNRIFDAKPPGGWLTGDIYIINTNAGYRSAALYGIGVFNTPSNSDNPDDWDYNTLTNSNPDYIGANIDGGGSIDIELQTGSSNPAVHFYIETPDTSNTGDVIYNDMYFRNQSLKYEYSKSADPSTYFNVEVLPKVKIMAAPPSVMDIPDGFFGVVNNTSDGTTKLYANIGGTLKSTILS